MEKVLLTIVAASGLCAVLSQAERHYYFIYDQKNITDALSYCREKYTDLATVDTMEDMNTLTAMANLSQMMYTTFSYRAWIGLYDDVNSWRWSLSNTSFYKPGGAMFRNWSPGEPNNYDSQEFCTDMYNNGYWNDVNCKSAFLGICSNVTGSSVTFVSTNISMTWTDAQNYCRTYYTDLASVRNVMENQKVTQLVPSGSKAWIGLFRDSWKWFDGGNSSFRFWGTSQPNDQNNQKACVAANFNDSGQWESFDCGNNRAFICYSAVSKRVVRMSLVKQSSSLNLNDSAVMEDILKQLEQKLKDKGVNEDVKLSWRTRSDGNVFHKDDDKEEENDKL